jgi:hypothetical protein
MTSPIPSPALRALVAGLVDYAGLFPPAELSMSDAVAHYASYRASTDAWMLGRFVVPVARLEGLAAEAARHTTTATSPWRLSALVGDDASADADCIRTFNASQAGRIVVDVAEVKAASAERIGLATRALGVELAVYVELPHVADPRALLEVVRGCGARAKIRTGGVTADAFPDAAGLARFIARCAELGVPFKATAGLHHPLRGDHRLTYGPDAPSATMFGFLNVFVAGALATVGVSEHELVAVLEERQGSAFTFGADGLRWRDQHVPLEQIARARASFAVAFGSCSFREPVDDLQELALL